MNKTAIKNFAIWARNKLISEITYKASLVGISEKGISAPLPTSTDNIQFFDIGTGKPTEIANEEVKQRAALVSRIKEKEKTSDYKTAFHFVMEEVAYTWFNRLVAIRFMEVNDYLPSKIRVLSSEMSGKAEPDMVTTPFDTDMEFNAYETDRIMQLKDENKLDELFRMLFIKQCNKLNEVLPELFEKTNDYTEYLLNISFTDKDGIVSHLVNDIEEKDFTEAVEIIGWLYQSYISEPKDLLINARSKYKNENVPFVTQLFTSDWIVKYIVDNSLGKYWLERNPSSKLADKLEFVIMPQNGGLQYVEEKVTPEELTFFDPCMGSGHILVYAFDVLMEIYRECGYVDRDAAQAIIENNLFGLDIDNRAYQLAYFAVMMKARSYDRRFLTREVAPQVYCPTGDNECSIFGSLLKVDILEQKPQEPEELTIFNLNWEQEIINWNFKRLLAQKYTIICTNPPYMNGSYMPTELKKYVETEYKDYKSDLFSAFMVRELELCKDNGYVGMLTPYVWMFISSYEKLRSYILSSSSISSLVQLEYNAFEGACVPVCSFVLHKTTQSKSGEYIKLSDFKGIENQAPKTLEAINNPNCGYRYTAQQENFSKIPGSPIAYWLSARFYDVLGSSDTIAQKYGDPKKGLSTGNNEAFLRCWFEVRIDNCAFGLSKYTLPYKWIPINKGGEYRKWYGNNTFVIDWYNNGSRIKAFAGSVIRNEKYYFKKSLTWTMISSACLGIRYSEQGKIFEGAGPSLFPFKDENTLYILALLSTKLGIEIINIFNPTMNININDIGNFPVVVSTEDKPKVDTLATRNIDFARADWDSFETSWDFVRHPLLNNVFVYPVKISEQTWEYNKKEDSKTLTETSVVKTTRVSGDSLIESAFENWEKECNERFNTLKANEEELNRIFIEIYGLQDELTPEVQDKDVTVRKADLTRDIKSFISYAVGCMFGRYSLDVDGLAYAGGDWDDSKYSTFIPDTDNVIPITDEEYFADDIVGLFVAFVKKVYGEETLEENLDFIAKALGNKGDTSRDVIRNYFVKDFYKDHVKTYQKRPIYWLYDSGKADGFKALVYMHRYTADTTGLVRVDYLHKMQRTYMSEIDRMQDEIENGKTSADISKAEKRKEKLIKQLKETKDYDEKIAHLALSRIAIDLDDGVKVNYDKVQTAQDGKKLDILGKIQGVQMCFHFQVMQKKIIMGLLY